MGVENVAADMHHDRRVKREAALPEHDGRQHQESPHHRCHAVLQPACGLALQRAKPLEGLNRKWVRSNLSLPNPQNKPPEHGPSAKRLGFFIVTS
jgi:hypothetical protein